MRFEISCPCGQTLSVQTENVGPDALCPQCGARLVIPPSISNEGTDPRGTQTQIDKPPETNAGGNRFDKWHRNMQPALTRLRAWFELARERIAVEVARLSKAILRASNVTVVETESGNPMGRFGVPVSWVVAVASLLGAVAFLSILVAVLYLRSGAMPASVIPVIATTEVPTATRGKAQADESEVWNGTKWGMKHEEIESLFRDKTKAVSEVGEVRGDNHRKRLEIEALEVYGLQCKVRFYFDASGCLYNIGVSNYSLLLSSQIPFPHRLNYTKFKGKLVEKYGVPTFCNPDRGMKNNTYEEQCSWNVAGKLIKIHVSASTDLVAYELFSVSYTKPNLPGGPGASL